MRVLMIAPPGAGKGTQGALIAAHFDIPHTAAGELLRSRGAADRSRPGRSGVSRPRELVPGQVVPGRCRTRRRSGFCRRKVARTRAIAVYCATSASVSASMPARFAARAVLR